MGNFQYKIGAGGTWTDVPETAHPMGDSGSIAVEFPKPTDFDGLGRPSGVPYRKKVVIKAAEMIVGSKGSGAAGQGTGMMWWYNFFASEDAQSGTANAFYVQALNPRTGAWEKWLGTLLTPQFEGITYSGSTAIYQNVIITIDDVSHTS